jgi:hypothetical protein
VLDAKALQLGQLFVEKSNSNFADMIGAFSSETEFDTGVTWKIVWSCKLV